MMHARTTRTILATSMSRFLPAIAAVAISFSGFTAYADTQSDLNTQLSVIAAQEGKATPTVSTAKADEIVYAVYELARVNPAYQTPQGAADLVTAALTYTGTANREKDKIAPRLVNAILQATDLGTGPNADTNVAQLVQAIVGVNGGTGAKALTLAGKTAVVAQALKSTSGVDGVGAALADVAAATNVAGSGDLALKNFLVNVGKTLGTAVGSFDEFSSQYLTKFGATEEANTTAVAKALAAKAPAAAGAVVAGHAENLADDAARQAYAVAIVADPALARAQADIVAGIASELTGAIDQDDFATALLNKVGATTAKVPTRANIASGILRTLPAASPEVDDVINAVLANKSLTAAEAATFAGAAAAGTGDLAAEVAFEVASKLAPSDFTGRKNVGVAVLKSINTTSPASGEVVAQRLIESANAIGQAFAGDPALKSLAVELAKSLKTQAPVLGSAIGGVAQELNDQTPTNIADLGSQTIKLATKAALNISQNLSALSSVNDHKAFAVDLATRVNNPTLAGAIAAGVAVTSVNGNNLVPPTGQTAGDIAVAVASLANNQAKTILIAGAVATAVNVEAVAELGGKVTSLLQKTTPAGTKYPNQGQLSVLAGTLAKAINVKPKATSTNVTPTTNRVDELGELAAEMTRSVVTTLGSGASITDLHKALGAVGSSILKSLAATNGLNQGGLQADLKDAAGDIAGAIAQTLSVLNLGPNPILTTANLNALLDTTSTARTTLYRQLLTAAKKEGGQVTTSFGQVAALSTGATLSDRLVDGNEALGVGQVPQGVTGKFEIGSLVDPETPFKNLP